MNTLDPASVLAAVLALTRGLESDNRRFDVVTVAVDTDRGALEVVDVALAVVHVARERTNSDYFRYDCGVGRGAGSARGIAPYYDRRLRHAPVNG